MVVVNVLAVDRLCAVPTTFISLTTFMQFCLHTVSRVVCFCLRSGVNVYADATIYLNQGVTLTYDLQDLIR